MAKTSTTIKCSIEGCPKFARVKGWCSAHYERWRRNGDPGGAGDGRSRPTVECSIEGCPNRARSRGWCNKHYACWRTTGDPIPRIRPGYGQGWRETHNGYIAVWEPTHPLAMSDGYVLEHRKVAWDAGLFTDRSMHVHHKDENKKNNDVSNLEPKSESVHHREHIQEAGEITNQYGTFPLNGAECSIDGCDLPPRNRGWCAGHYSRFLRSGDPLGHSKRGYKKGVKA